MSRTLSAIRANVGGISLVMAWAASAAALAWAVAASGLFASYAPFSWVVGGFVGAVLAVAIWRIALSGHRQLVHNRYDAKLLAQGGPIDPLAKTFESRRIYLNDFALPSKPLIEAKTFIDCEIIGPANIVLIGGNSVSDHRLPACDALVIAEGAEPSNGYAFRDCIFRGCSFVRITLLVTQAEYQSAKTVNWLRWISMRPEGQGELLLEPHYAVDMIPTPAE